MTTHRIRQLFAVKLPLCCMLLVMLNMDAGAVAQKIDTPSSTSCNQAAVVKDVVFHSASLQRDMRYRVLFPCNYENGGRFPVLYLLHGLFGDYLNWDTRTNLENYARNLPLLIIMPDADDSWYTNSATVPRDKFEDYIAKDLISEVDNQYRTIRDRHARAIAGLSMGGYGAIKLGLKYPDLFAFVGSLSGALNATGNFKSDLPEKLLEVFGKEGSPQRKENDVFQLLINSQQGNYPYFYLACGENDPLVDTNRDFVRQLSLKKIAYEYHETPGIHAWDYWDRSLAPMLQAVERTIIGNSLQEYRHGQ